MAGKCLARLTINRLKKLAEPIRLGVLHCNLPISDHRIRQSLLHTMLSSMDTNSRPGSEVWH